jgi:hypothetical protein
MQPSDLSFSWSWQEINQLLDLGEDVIPFDASEVRHRDTTSLKFCSDKETNFCKPILSYGDIYEIGILTSKKFLKSEE